MIIIRTLIYILLSPILFLVAILYGLIAILFAFLEWVIDVDGRPTV